MRSEIIYYDDDEEISFEPDQAKLETSPIPDLGSPDDFILKLPKPGSSNVSSFIEKAINNHNDAFVY